MDLKCVKEMEGLTVGKVYKMLGVAGEHVEIIDDNGEKAILFESYFEIVS